jgi:hypothetical protein
VQGNFFSVFSIASSVQENFFSVFSIASSAQENFLSVFSMASSVKKNLPYKIVSLYSIFFSKIVCQYRFNRSIFEYRCPSLLTLSSTLFHIAFKQGYSLHHTVYRELYCSFFDSNSQNIRLRHCTVRKGSNA